MIILKGIRRYISIFLLVLATVVKPLLAFGENDCNVFYSQQSINHLNPYLYLERIKMDLNKQDVSIRDILYFSRLIRGEVSRLNDKVRKLFPGGFREIEATLTTGDLQNDPNQKAELALSLIEDRKKLVHMSDFAHEAEARYTAMDLFRRANQFLRETDVFQPPVIEVSTSVEQAIQISKAIKFNTTKETPWGGTESRLRGEQLEGEVADFVLQKWGDILSFNEKMRDPVTNKYYETDIKMGRAFIEITYAPGGKTKQILERYFSNFVNPAGLPVILYGPSISLHASTELLKMAAIYNKPLVIVRTFQELETILNLLYR